MIEAETALDAELQSIVHTYKCYAPSSDEARDALSSELRTHRTRLEMQAVQMASQKECSAKSRVQSLHQTRRLMSVVHQREELLGLDEAQVAMLHRDGLLVHCGLRSVAIVAVYVNANDMGVQHQSTRIP